MPAVDVAAPAIGRPRTVRRSVQAVRTRRLNRPERLALIAVAGTPIALVLDYRLGTALLAQSISFRQLIEDAGRVVTYQQVFGVTQLLWLAIGARSLAGRWTRAGFQSPPAIALLLFVVLLAWVTVLRSSIDSFTVLALSSNLLPMLAMVGVLCHPGIRPGVLVRLVAIFAAETAVIVLITAANALATGTLGNRLGFVLFGSSTDAAMSLAVLVPLALILPGRRRSYVVVSLFFGLFLTQTRGATAGAVLGLLTASLLDPTFRLTRSRVVLSLGSAVLVAALLINRPLPLVHDVSGEYREVYLAQHWRYLRAQPVTGYGLSAGAANFFRAAHDTLLSIADAGGLGAMLLWLLAWTWPARSALRRPRTPGAAAAVGAIVAAVTAWISTGGEVLIYVPATNLLPLALAVALALAARRLRSTHTR